MEKLIYVLDGATDELADRLDRIAADVVPAARGVGGERIAILLPDEFGAIAARAPGRLMGDPGRIAAIFECWVPTVDRRAAIETALAPHATSCWGYLVTESTMDPCDHDLDDGARVPGISQWTINDKPAAVALDDFYREWSVHSILSFDLHPERDSYIRNAIVRALTTDAPRYLGIVIERFPSLEVFVDDARYFGDPAVTKEMIEHTPTFYDFATAISGGFSEYRWR
ncbi:MAG: hypothetical protein AAGC67_09120 [Myxococcota bacterium]